MSARSPQGFHSNSGSGAVRGHLPSEGHDVAPLNPPYLFGPQHLPVRAAKLMSRHTAGRRTEAPGEEGASLAHGCGAAACAQPIPEALVGGQAHAVLPFPEI